MVLTPLCGMMIDINLVPFLMFSLLEFSSVGFRISNKVKDVIGDSSQFQPDDWLSIIPQLNDFQLSVLDPLVDDKVL